VLLKKPGLTNLLPQPDSDQSACPGSYHTLYLLQHSRLHPSSGHAQQDNMSLRARLKQQDATLYQHFLDNILLDNRGKSS